MAEPTLCPVMNRVVCMCVHDSDKSLIHVFDNDGEFVATLIWPGKKLNTHVVYT